MSIQPHDALLERLRQERSAIESTLRSLDETGKPVVLDQTTQGRVSRIDAIGQQEMAKAGRSHLATQLQRIDAALARGRSGRYGICCRCEEPVPIARLEADPAAPFCLDCTRELAAEREREQHGRGVAGR